MNKLREAAQAVVKAYLAEPDEDGGYSVLTMREIDALRDALAEDEDTEYELWGIIMGSPGGRWVTSQVENHKIYPVGTALWVKIGRGQE